LFHRNFSKKDFGNICKRDLIPTLYFWKLDTSTNIGEIGFILQMKVGLGVIFKKV